MVVSFDLFIYYVNSDFIHSPSCCPKTFFFTWNKKIKILEELGNTLLEVVCIRLT